MNEPIVIGNCTLYRGDCLEVMPSLPLGSIDMVMADLPYGTTACKWDSVIPFEPLWACYRAACKKNAAIVLTASQPFTSALVLSQPDMFRYEWIWRKGQGTNPRVCKVQPLKSHENVAVFYQIAPRYYPQMGAGAPYRGFKTTTGATIGSVYSGSVDSVHRDNPEGTRYPKTVLDVKSDRHGFHPTQKPVALMEYLIRAYTNEGETVLDNTMGSGTTGVACVNTGRKFVGIEMDEAYFEIACNRIRKAVEEKRNLA